VIPATSVVQMKLKNPLRIAVPSVDPVFTVPFLSEDK
jgi:hypothetical protein